MHLASRARIKDAFNLPTPFPTSGLNRHRIVRASLRMLQPRRPTDRSSAGGGGQGHSRIACVACGRHAPSIVSDVLLSRSLASSLQGSDTANLKLCGHRNGTWKRQTLCCGL